MKPRDRNNLWWSLGVSQVGEAFTQLFVLNSFQEDCPFFRGHFPSILLAIRPPGINGEMNTFEVGSDGLESSGEMDKEASVSLQRLESESLRRHEFRLDSFQD
eukprot:scaffold5576_cov107-Cylindrotheca_fusiformis.AAC.3